MTSRIKIPDFRSEEARRRLLGEVPLHEADMVPTAVDLPPKRVIDAGTKKFLELAKLYWPSRDGVMAFDMRNMRQLQMALGVAYLEMKHADENPG